MKTKTIFTILAFLASSLIAGADTPALEASLVAYAEGKAVSGLATTPYYMSDEAAHAALAEEVVTALQAGESFVANTHLVLTPYGNAFYAAGDDSAAAEVFRASGNYGSVQFLMKSATRTEILEHLLGINANVYKIVKDSAAPRLGDSELADTVAASLVGHGIVGGPVDERVFYGPNDWIEWFDARIVALSRTDTVASLEQATSMLWSEIVGLESKPESEARNQRIYELRGALAVRQERLKQLK